MFHIEHYITCLISEEFAVSILFNQSSGEKGWRSGESTRLPPMWPEFDSQIRRYMY